MAQQAALQVVLAVLVVALAALVVFQQQVALVQQAKAITVEQYLQAQLQLQQVEAVREQ